MRLSVPLLVEQTATASPLQIAVRDADGQLTYAELIARAERVAAELRGLGVGPGELVGLCLERSVGLVVAGLAILRAGAAYVAVDTAYPDERVRWMLDDAAVAATVTDPATATRLSSGRATVVLSPTGELLSDPVPVPVPVAAPGGTGADASAPRPDPSADASAPRPNPGDPAYVVYTSGSTGQPKGVVIEHGGLTNLVAWHRRAFALGPDDRCTQIASPGFDATVWEIWPSLAAGATLAIVPEELRRDPVRLRDWLVAERITVTFLPTVLAEELLGLPWPDTAALRYLLTGGDALSRRPAPGFGFTVVNNYGLSETTVVTSSGEVAPGVDGVPSIGRPIDGVTVEVLDDALNPVAAGAEGELVIGGVSVGRGYLHRPELTAERFLSGERGRRYRTGDRVRIRADGEIEYLGRLDEQLSVRGFRIEPGEVVGALNSHPGIGASVAVAIGEASAERRLVAYVVSSGAERPPRANLDLYLGGLLPPQLVPSTYVWLDELPLTPHGKLDREALPPPIGLTAPISERSSPQTPVEAATASLMAELLGLKEIGREQNFFLLGGHSMLGAQLIARLENRFDIEVGLRYLFDHPTAAAIAEEVERQLAGDEADRLETG